MTTVVRFALLASFLVSASSADAQQAKPAAWPMFGGDASRNMVNLSAKNLPVKWNREDGTNILWTAELGSRGYAPIVAGGKVFVGTNNESLRDKSLVRKDGKPLDAGVLMVFDQASGRFLWQSAFLKLKNGTNDWPLQGLRAAPTVEGERMYFLSSRHQVVCSDLDGKIVWMTDLIEKLKIYPHDFWGGATVSSVLIVGDHLYLITGNGVDASHCNLPAPEAPSFVKLSKKDGSILWHDNTPTKSFVPFKNSPDALKIYQKLVDRAELVSHGQWSSPAYAKVAGQGQIIFPAGDGWIYSFTPEGKLLWKFDGNPKDAVYTLGNKGTRSDYMAMPVIYKDRVYIGMGQDPEYDLGVGHFWCIAMDKRGDVSPELVVNADVTPPITRPNPNSALVWGFGGLVPEKDVKKLKRSYYFNRTMSTCAIHGDLVYIADYPGVLHCLDANSGKSYWDHDARSRVYASPLWADGKIYVGAEGNVLVFAHGKEKKLLATNDMNGRVQTPVAAVDGVLYIVDGSDLVAIGKKR